MSILNIIKLRLGLGPAAENHHWDGSVPNQLSLLRGTPEAPGTELIKALNGILSFPNQGQSLTENGYVKLPGGLIVQWGVTGTVLGQEIVTFPIPFPNAMLRAVATPVITTQSADLLLAASILPQTASSMIVIKRFILGVNIPDQSILAASWIAIGY